MNLKSLRKDPYLPRPSMTSLAIILLAVPVLSFILWKNDPLITDENAILEWAQAVFLLLACFVHGERAFRLNKSSLNFSIRAGLALLTYSFVLRELNINQLGTSEIWTLAEQFLRLAGVALWAAFLFVLTPRFKQIFSRRSAILAMPVISLTMLGGLFFAAGWPFDKQIFSSLPLAYSRFIEEVLELNACIVLFAASLTGSSIRTSPAKTVGPLKPVRQVR